MGNKKGSKMAAPTKQQLRELIDELREEVSHMKNQLAENESLREKLAQKIKDKNLVEIEKVHEKERQLEVVNNALSSVQKRNVELLRENKAKLEEMAQLVPSDRLPQGHFQVIDPDLIDLHKGDGWRFDVYLEIDNRQKLLTRIPVLYSDYAENIEIEDLEAALKMRNHLKDMYCEQVDYPVTINFSHASSDLRNFY